MCGQVYKGVEDAGKCVLADHANGYPNTDVNSMLPPIFVTTYPEPREPTAENQLTGGSKFLRALMAAVAGTSVVLPYVQVICVPNDPSPSLLTKSALASYRLNEDVISQQKDFHHMFDQFVQDLITEKANVAFSSEQQFVCFVRFVVGLWSSNPTPSGVVFEPSKASLIQGMLNEKEITPQIQIGERSF